MYHFDDEAKAIELLKDSLCIVNDKIEIINSYTTWPEGLNAIRTKACDILFLDISIQGKKYHGHTEAL